MEDWGDGVLECCKKDINPSTITPTLQCSCAPKLIGIQSSQDGLLSFGVYLRLFILNPSGFFNPDQVVLALFYLTADWIDIISYVFYTVI